VCFIDIASFYIETSQVGHLAKRWTMNGLSILEDLAKSIQKATPKGVDEAKYKRCKEKVKRKSPDVNEYAVCTAALKKKSFIKSGPGGVQFDFGAMTGNPVADKATFYLNQFADPMQEQIASMQAGEITEAFGRHIEKGDVYAHDPSYFWNKQFSGSTDAAIKEMFEKGQLQDNGPALCNSFNDKTLSLDGQVIKATSETDAALIEMMKQGLNDGDFS
jgi:hypothetical protein